jgi:hypothetical protein
MTHSPGAHVTFFRMRPAHVRASAGEDRRIRDHGAIVARAADVRRGLVMRPLPRARALGRCAAPQVDRNAFPPCTRIASYRDSLSGPSYKNSGKFGLGSVAFGMAAMKPVGTREERFAVDLPSSTAQGLAALRTFVRRPIDRCKIDGCRRFGESPAPRVLRGEPGAR